MDTNPKQEALTHVFARLCAAIDEKELVVKRLRDELRLCRSMLRTGGDVPVSRSEEGRLTMAEKEQGLRLKMLIEDSHVLMLHIIGRLPFSASAEFRRKLDDVARRQRELEQERRLLDEQLRLDERLAGILKRFSTFVGP